MDTTITLSNSPDPVNWMAFWLQGNDTFYPTGTYAHSFGLEGAVQEGLITDLASFERFLHTAVLPVLARVELPLTNHAHQALTHQNWPRFTHVCQTARAMKTAREPREASEGIGRQRLSLLGLLHPHPLISEAVRHLGTDRGWPSCVAIALESQVLRAPIDAALTSVCYGTLSSSVSAIMKILRLGQNAMQQTLATALSHVPTLVTQARKVPFDEIGWSNPWWDVAAMRHELAEERLFIS